MDRFNLCPRKPALRDEWRRIIKLAASLELTTTTTLPRCIFDYEEEQFEQHNYVIQFSAQALSSNEDRERVEYWINDFPRYPIQPW